MTTFNRYKLSETCPDTVIIQSLPSGDYDYSYCGSIEAAIDEVMADVDLDGVREIAVEAGDENISPERVLEMARKEARATLEAFTQEEVLQAAEGGYGWPVELGFVIELPDE